MSTTFSANLGSFESLKVRVRCGLRPCSFQMRCTVVWPTPISSASIRALQCVAFAGFSLAVRVTIASRTLFEMKARGLTEQAAIKELAGNRRKQDLFPYKARMRPGARLSQKEQQIAALR